LEEKIGFKATMLLLLLPIVSYKLLQDEDHIGELPSSLNLAKQIEHSNECGRN
jgi:hypothetical protein